MTLLGMEVISCWSCPRNLITQQDL